MDHVPTNMSRRTFWLFSAMIFGGLLYLLAPVLTPFVFAALLSYLGDPLVDQLEERGFSRTTSVVLVFTAIILTVLMLVLIFVPLLQGQLSGLIRRLPNYLSWLQENIWPWMQRNLGISPNGFDATALQAELRQYLDTAGNVAAKLISSVSKSTALLLSWLANLVLVPVVTFYLLRDWDILVARVNHLIPRHIEPTVSQLARESDEMLGAFLRGQFIVMMALALVYSTGLAVVGLDFALLIGLIAGFVSFVPYLGFIVGIVIAGAVALLQFQDFIHLILVIGVFGVGQALEGMVLTPRLVGERIGLHPVAVIFAVLAGGQLFGFFGILLALPVAAVINVMLRHSHERYMKSAIYGQGGEEAKIVLADSGKPGAGKSKDQNV